MKEEMMSWQVENSNVLAWLGLEATGFGLDLGGFGLALAGLA